LGAAQCWAVNERLVYSYSPGWGSDGPDARRQAFAPQFSGLVGLQYLAGGEGNDPVVPYGNEDNANGLVGALGIVLALYSRLRTGNRIYVENPQIHAAMALEPDCSVDGAGQVRLKMRLDGRQMGVHPLDRLYETHDGGYVAIGAITDPEFERLGAALGVSSLGTDPRFESVVSRAEHRAALTDELEKRIGSMDISELGEGLRRAQVDFAVPTMNGDDVLFASPAEKELGRVVVHDHPMWGRVQCIGALLRVDGRTPPSGRAPLLGEHTDAVLEELGVAPAEIAALHQAGVVA
jgi:crotonobetainyl-CoA:carnitine CoA-transferase CaiB-like acyl-CoA transferase